MSSSSLSRQASTLPIVLPLKRKSVFAPWLVGEPLRIRSEARR